jgi:hypothetical protein
MAEPSTGHEGVESRPPDRRSLRELIRVARSRAGTADPHDVAEALRVLGHRAWWGVPLVLAGRTLDALVSAVLLVTTTARLALLEVVPALWLGAITWDWRVHSTGELPLPAVHGWVAWVVAGGILIVNTAAYWCNAVLTFALREPPPVRLRNAVSAARVHGPTITAWALAIGVVHVVVSVVLARTTVGWYFVGITIVVVAQMYALVALPVSLAGLSFKGIPRRQRLTSTLTTAGLTLIALVPGIVLARVAVGLMGLDVPGIGVLVLVLAVVLQVAATSSVHTVALATKLNVASANGSRR